MPIFVPDRLALKEIAFQTVGVAALVRLTWHSKKTWPTFPISIGRCTLSNRQHAEREARDLERLQLCRAPHRFFDPKYKIKDMFVHFNLSCPEHQSDLEEEKFQEIFDYVERLKEVASPEEMMRARFRAIDIRTDRFEKRDLLLKSSPTDIEQVEEVRRQQRAERWDKGVAASKKKANKASGAKSLTVPAKKAASTQAGASQTTVSETDADESRKK